MAQKEQNVDANDEGVLSGNDLEIEYFSKTYKEIFLPALRQFAQERCLKYEEDKDLKTFFFQKEGSCWWYAFQFEKLNWNDFVYGVFYEGSNRSKKRLKFEKLLENSQDDGGAWTTYKYFDEPYKDWGSKVFEEIKKNPLEFITKHIFSKIEEIDKALEQKS